MPKCLKICPYRACDSMAGLLAVGPFYTKLKSKTHSHFLPSNGGLASDFFQNKTCDWSKKGPSDCRGSKDCVSTKADIYSFGVVLWEIVTGLSPRWNTDWFRPPWSAFPSAPLINVQQLVACLFLPIEVCWMRWRSCLKRTEDASKPCYMTLTKFCTAS